MIRKICILLFSSIGFTVFSQQPSKSQPSRVMFYNVENLFDTYDDPATNDNDFLPTAKKFWSLKRYQAKIDNLSKVFAAIGEWKMPVIIGLCEVENEKVLKDLFLNSALSKYNYKMVHYDSPDPRGIDVAMMYLPDQFRLLHSHIIRVQYHKSKEKSTRDILYCKGILLNKDTLHVYINHWPSRRNGEEADIKRSFVAALLRSSVDSVFKRNPNANIIIMGDFNDESKDASLCTILGASQDFKSIKNNTLYNLSADYMAKNNYGSLKFRGHWNLFDHIILSGSILTEGSKIYSTHNSYHIFNAPFIIKQDRSHTGSTPLRTFNGNNWENGFSDHLPVYVDLFCD